MLATLAATVTLIVAPSAHADPSCPRAATGYDFGLSVDARRLTHPHSERGALVFSRHAVVLMFRRSITVYNIGRRPLRLTWSCQS